MKPKSAVGPGSHVAADTVPTRQIQARFDEGLTLHHQGLLTQAQEVYRQVLMLQPRHAQALHLLGVIAAQSKNYEQAVELISRSIEITPGNAAAHANLGNAFRDCGQYQAAVDSYDKAIALKPDYANVYFNRGIALHSLKHHQAAIDSYDKAIAIKPDSAETYFHRGNALCELRRYSAAVDSYDKAIGLRPDHVDAYSNRGAALHFLKQYQAAIESYDKAIAIKPDIAETYCNRGLALSDWKRLEAAIESYDKAIAIAPDRVEYHFNRGLALTQSMQHQAALASYEKAIGIRPDYEFLHGIRLYTKMNICDWTDEQNQIAKLLQKVQRNEKVCPPFSFLALSTSLPLQRKAAEVYAKQKYPASEELGAIPKRARGQKIRIGYFSMDFRDHAVSFLTAGLFETHDRDRFEVYAFSFGPDAKDGMRTRLEAAFDRFIDVKDKSDQEIAQMARQMEIDIAIDLAGFTTGSRTGIFALRAAPIQVNYLGYPGTMGVDYMDYLVADRVLIPQESQQHYAEKIAYLPDTYMVNDSRRSISDRKFSREELELPESGFVFCCFNNSYKITPEVFEGWMRILKQVEGSVLWLSETNPAATSNLRKEAVQRGVDQKRLVFARKLPLMAEHLARQRAADLFIDTLPYNAHTTASDALWAGLPVLTCTGEAFASRVAASLLGAIGLPELITRTRQDYEALAIELATHPERLKAIRQKLERNRLTTPLFDTVLFTRNIEDAYTQMFERYQADLPPGPIHVRQG